KGHRLAGIDEYRGAEARVVVREPDGHALGATKELPVDLRRIVALLVGAVLHELGRRTHASRAVLAVQRSSREAAGRPVRPAHGVQQGSAGGQLPACHRYTRMSLRGAATCARTSPTSCSAVTPSASAAKFGSTRWRST